MIIGKIYSSLILQTDDLGLVKTVKKALSYSLKETPSVDTGGVLLCEIIAVWSSLLYNESRMKRRRT